MDSKFKIFDKVKQLGELYCATIELCTLCNWKCKHCYHPSHTYHGPRFKEWERVFDELRDNGCFDITFTGGEIFCRKDAMKIIKLAREKHFLVNLFTNISLLNEEKIKVLKDIYVQGISCTIYSLDPKKHDEITGVPGSLNKTLKNLDLILKHKIDLEVKTILTNVDPTAYNELTEFCQNKGISYLVTSNIWERTNNDEQPKLLSLTHRQLEQAIPAIDRIVDFGRKKVTPESYICNSIKYSVFIDSNLKVYPCNNMLVEVGDLKKETLYNIWWNSSKLKHIKSLQWKDCKSCRDCDAKDSCDRCAGIIELEEGDMLAKSSEFCKRAMIRYKNASR